MASHSKRSARHGAVGSPKRPKRARPLEVSRALNLAKLLECPGTGRDRFRLLRSTKRIGGRKRDAGRCACQSWISCSDRYDRLLWPYIVISCPHAVPPRPRRPRAPRRLRLLALARPRAALIRVIRVIRGRLSPIANRKSKIRPHERLTRTANPRNDAAVPPAPPARRNWPGRAFTPACGLTWRRDWPPSAGP